MRISSSSYPLMLALLLSGLPAPMTARGQSQTAQPVTAVRARRGPVTQTLELTGTVTARRQSRLSARTSGLIQRLPVDAGDVAREGAVLLELDAALAQLALERAQTEKKQAALELAEAERLVTESARLAKVGGFSRSEAQTRETTVQVRRAQLESLDVRVREQEELVARHQLLAPFAGVISRKLAEEGEWVQTGTPVLELVETGALRLDVQAPQEALALLHAGGHDGNGAASPRAEPPAIDVRLDAFPDRALTAQIVAQVPVKDATARTFLVRLEMEDRDYLAAPGMSARVTFTFRSADDVLQAPRDAVVRFPDGSAKVWVIEETGGPPTVASREVKLGFSLRETLEIVSGLEGTPLLVLRGNEGLREGQPVSMLVEEK